jgi:hypothetical protein
MKKRGVWGLNLLFPTASMRPVTRHKLSSDSCSNLLGAWRQNRKNDRDEEEPRHISY